MTKLVKFILLDLMRWSELFSLRISEHVLKNLEKNKDIKFHLDKESLHKRIAHLIDLNFEEEKKIEDEARKMMDALEDQGQSFQRHVMYPLLKKQLAKKKGFVL